MGFKDLKVLFDKEKRVYLILAIWILVGYTIFQFASMILGMIILLPLLCLSLVFFLISIILRDKIQENVWKVFIASLVLAIPLLFLYLYSFIGSMILRVISFFAMQFFFIITGILTMNDWYNRSIKWDGKIKQWPKPLNNLVRSIIFVGGLIISTILILVFALLALVIRDTSYTFELVIVSVLYDMIIIMWLLFIIGIVAVFFSRVNFWLGIFFIFITVLAINIIISAVIFERGPSSVYLPFLIIQYIISLYLLLGSIAEIFGEQAEFISKKSKFFTPETILIWLIYCAASVQWYAGVTAPVWDEYVLVFTAFTFPIIAFIFGVYGIRSYHKKQKKENISELNEN